MNLKLFVTRRILTGNLHSRPAEFRHYVTPILDIQDFRCISIVDNFGEKVKNSGIAGPPPPFAGE